MSVYVCVYTITKKRSEQKKWNFVYDIYTKNLDVYQLLDWIHQPEIALPACVCEALQIR